MKLSKFDYGCLGGLLAMVVYVGWSLYVPMPPRLIVEQQHVEPLHSEPKYIGRTAEEPIEYAKPTEREVVRYVYVDQYGRVVSQAFTIKPDSTMIPPFGGSIVIGSLTSSTIDTAVYRCCQ